MLYSQRFLSGKYHQNGSALMLALFVIIVVLLLGTSLVRVLSTSSETVAQEVIGTRALMAANSGMQAHLQILFPLSTDADTPHPEGVCTNTLKTYPLKDAGNDIVGLYHCEAKAICTLITEHDGVKYYKLTSTGSCGTDLDWNSDGVVDSSRTIQVEARSL